MTLAQLVIKHGRFYLLLLNIILIYRKLQTESTARHGTARQKYNNRGKHEPTLFFRHFSCRAVAVQRGKKESKKGQEKSDRAGCK